MLLRHLKNVLGVAHYGAVGSDTASELGDHAAMIRRNALLSLIYEDVYARILREIPAARYPRLLELGSGGGFFRELAPHAMTSELEPVEGIDRAVDACRIDHFFEPSSLDAIAAFNVFHHLPDVHGFLTGAARVLRPGGRVVLVEPWFTPLGQWFYRAIHHEPSLLDPNEWRLVGAGRLEGANSRLPTSVFRDSDVRFAREFPSLRIVKREPFHKWLYLLSGGVTLNTRVPAFVARPLVELDRRLRLGNETLGIFGLVVVERDSGR
jgi:SAM-dependent methyltransferase